MKRETRLQQLQFYCHAYSGKEENKGRGEGVERERGRKEGNREEDRRDGTGTDGEKCGRVSGSSISR